jgi:hypothetical protein
MIGLVKKEIKISKNNYHIKFKKIILFLLQNFYLTYNNKHIIKNKHKITFNLKLIFNFLQEYINIKFKSKRSFVNSKKNII